MTGTRTFAFSILAASLLFGCGGDESPKAPGQKTVRDTLNYANTKDIRNINPHLYLGEMSAQAMVFEPLVFNTASGPVPALATSWTVSEDAKTYTFKLREGVNFTDGTPFDSAAAKANIEAVLANRKRHAWLELANAIDKVEAPSKYELVIRLHRTYSPALIELGLSRPFRFISPKCLENGTSHEGVRCLAGTGPWVLSEHQRNSHAVFARNENYWGEAPKLAKVRWKVMPDAQTMLMALQKGEIDLIFGADGDQVSLDSFTALQRKNTLVTSLSNPVASRAILINSNRPITKDAAVRRAIWHAVDVQSIVAGILNGSESVAKTLMAKNVPGCDVPLQEVSFDRKKSAGLLEAAGWIPGADGIRVKDGKRLELGFYFNTANMQEKTIAQAIQSDLAKVGIDLKIIGEEKQTFLDRQRSGEFDLQYSLSWGTPYDPHSYFSSWRYPAHGDYQAQVGLADKKHIDESVDRLLAEPDEAKRNAIIADILTRVHDSSVYLPISYSRTKAVHSPELKGVEFSLSQYEIPFEKMHF